MQLEGHRESSNVETRGGGGRMLVGGGMGTLALALVAMFFGIDPRIVLQNAPAPRQSQTRGAAQNADPETKERTKFVSRVLADTEDAWHKMLPEYRDPKLVIFSGQVQSACGTAGASTGPFYCGEDENLYIDLSFYDELSKKFGAPGDFAQAYVIAHEVGHHVQNVRGTLAKVHNAMSHASKAERNAISVRLELQADYYAGVWAHHAQGEGILEAGDVDEALNAASAIGDDRLQQQGRGYVVPDSFTHGSSAQRVRWFKKGLESGDPNGGDTFNTNNL